MKESSPSPVAPGRGARPRAASLRPRLLVIEDDRASQVVLTRLLEESGYHVQAADDGESGLELTRSFRPDVVVCDWIMPGMDGLGYCRAVKSDPELRETYVTLISARDGSDDRVVGLDAGADDYLSKPFEVDELRARVRAGLRTRRLQDDLAGDHRRAMLREVATSVGHEINNPLTALFGHMELCLQYLERGDVDRMQHHIQEAGALASRIGDVVQRLIRMAEPQSKVYLGQRRMLDLEPASRD